jgi:hypothetical protein
LAKSFSARTKGRATRTIKKALIPGYGNKGMGILHPKKALYNKVYHKTSFNWPGRNNEGPHSNFPARWGWVYLAYAHMGRKRLHHLW